MKKYLFLFSLLAITATASAQKYFTKNGTISFDATASGSPENITADNRTVTCVVDGSNGNIQFKSTMKAFTFERALMQEHFNENYVESDKYPEAVFKGVITNVSTISFGKDGSYPATVKGKLTLHGVEKEVESAGTIIVAKGKVTAKANFNVLLSDYNIKVPSVVADKVSNTAKIAVNCGLEPLK
ncbi:MAG: YceI family protein [Bacteroidetes bacterium]|nr:YceI family protein [Bacteroidota bacterium]